MCVSMCHWRVAHLTQDVQLMALVGLHGHGPRGIWSLQTNHGMYICVSICEWCVADLPQDVEPVALAAHSLQ